MCTPKWRSILVDWINCLQETEIKELKELKDGDILLTIIGQLVSTKASKENFKSVEQFMQTKYPTFDWPENYICDGGETSITTAVTLMMHYACVRSNNVEIRRTMCNKLTAVEQQTIMQFNTFIMKNSLETSEDLRLAIVYACGDELESSEAGESSLESQAISEATPPATRLLHDQRMEIRRLRGSLEAERFDRTYLQDEVKRLQHTTDKLTEHREKSQKQISLLKSLLESKTSPESPKSEKGTDDTEQNARLGRQLQDLEDRLVNVQAEVDKVTEERDTFKRKLESMRLEKEEWLKRVTEESIRADCALQEAMTQQEQVGVLQEQVADLRAHLLRSRDPNDSSAMCDADDFDSSTRFRSAADFSAISEDLCSNVVEVQLSEQRVLCEGLQKKLKAVEEDLAKMTNEKEIVVEANEMLCEKIKTFETDHTDLQNIVRNQQGLLLAQMEHLHTMSLNVQSKCENEINKILNELNHLLTDPKTRIVDNFQENVKLLLRINSVATQLINELQAGNDEKNVLITHLRRNIKELKESLRICDSDKKYLSEGVKTIMDVNDTIINKKCGGKIDDLKNRIDVLNNLVNVLSVKTKYVFDVKNINIQKLQSELESEMQKNFLLQVKCDEISSETNEKIKRFEKQIMIKESDISDLKEQQRHLESNIGDLKNTLDRESLERKSMKMSFMNAEEKINEMETAIELKKVNISKLEEEQLNLETKIKELENNLKQERLQSKGVENELQKTKEKNVHLQNCIVENNKKFEEESLKLQSSIDNLSRLLENENLQKTAVQTECQNLINQIKNLESEITIKEKDIYQLREEYNNSQILLENEILLGKGLKLNCEDLHEKNNNLETEFKRLENKYEKEILERKKIKFEYKEAAKTAEERILLKENDLSNSEKEKCAMVSKLKDLRKDFEREIQTTQVVFKEAEKKINSMEKEIILKENDLLELKEKYHNLKTERIELQNKLKTEIQQKKTLEIELLESKNKEENLGLKINSNEKVISQFKEEHHNLKSHIKNIQENNEKLNSDLMEMGEQMGQLTCAFEDEKTARNNLIVKTEKCIKEKDKNIVKLTDLLKLEEQSNNALKNQVSALEINISSLTDTISTLNNEVIELKEFKNKYNEIIVTLEQEKKEFCSKESAMQINLSRTENILTEMTKEKNKFKEFFDEITTVLENERYIAKQTMENINTDLKLSKNIVTEILREKNEFQNELKVLKVKLDETEMVLYRERDMNVENFAKLKLDIVTHSQKHKESSELLRVELKQINNMYPILSEDYEKQKAVYETVEDKKNFLENEIEKYKEHISKLDCINNKNLEVISKHENILSVRKNIVNEYIEVTFNLNNQIYKLQKEQKKLVKDLEMEKNLVKETEEHNKALNIKCENLVEEHERKLENLLQEQKENQKEIMKYIEDEIRSKKCEVEKNLKEMNIQVQEHQKTIDQNFHNLRQIETKLNAKIADVGLKEKRICILNNLVAEFKKQVLGLESSLTRVTEDKLSLEKDLESKESEILQLNSHLNENMRENNDLNAELEQMRHTHDKLLSMFVYDKEDLAKVTKVKVDLEKHVQLTEEKCDKLLLALENEQKYNAELNIKLEYESMSVTESSVEKNKLVDQIKQLKINSEELLEKLQKERSNWEENVCNLETNLASKEGILSTVLQEKNQISNELDICKKDYEITISGLQKEINEKTDLIRVLEEELTVKEERLQKMIQDINDLKQECNNISNVLERNKQELSLKVDLIAENKKVISELQTKNNKLLVTIEEEKQNKAEILSKLEIDVASKVEVLSSKNEMLKNELQRCEELEEERTSEFNLLLKKLDAVTEKQDQLEDGNVETIHDYEEQLAAKTEELHRLQNEMCVIVQDNNSMIYQLNDINNEVLKLRKEINEKNQEIENIGTQNRDLQLKHEQLINNKDDEIQSCNEKIVNLTEEMDSLRLDKEKLRSEVNQLTNHLEKLNTDFDACQIESKNLKITNSQIIAMNSENGKEIQDLKSKVISLEKEKDDLIKEKDDSSREYTKIKEMLDNNEKIMFSIIDRFSIMIASINEEGKNYDTEKDLDAIVELLEKYLNKVSVFTVAENIKDTVSSESDASLLVNKFKRVSSQIISMKKENLENQKKLVDIHLDENCKINNLSEKINVLNESLFKRNNEIEEFLNMVRDKDAKILSLQNEVKLLYKELTVFKEQSVNVDNLETVICEKNSQITNFHREVTYLKTIIAESENKLMDVNKELKDTREKLAAVNKVKNDENETIKVSAKLQSLVHQWTIENRNAVALQEITHLSNITNDDNENRAFEKQNIFDTRNSTFKSESGVTLDQLESLLESSVKRDKLSSDRINLLQQEREHLMLQNKTFKNENESLKKSVFALKERSHLNENSQSVKCLNELSAYFKTFSSVRNTYKLKLQKINSIQKLIKKEILQIKNLSPEILTTLEKKYLNNIEETFDIVFLYADWSQHRVDQSISSLKPSQSSLNVSDIQNITLDIQLDRLVSTFSNLLEETGNLRMGVKSGPPVPSRRNLTGHVGPPGGQGDSNEVHRRISEVRAEYEDKLIRMKAKMKQLYQEQIAVYKERQREELSTIEKELCKERTTLTERTKAYQQHVASLTDELWKVGEKLLVEKNEADWLRKKRQSCSLLSLQNTTTASAHASRGMGRPNRPLDTQSLRSVRESNKSESGGLHMSDEEGEVFDNRWLQELSCTPKAPTQTNDAFDNQRYSELRWRNSLCPPHLKSSYPAETQFHMTSTYAEHDIKSESDARAPPLRKEVGITAYKKPGPPTPSKNAGRLSATDSELRESIRSEPDAAMCKKGGTPSRLKSLLGLGTSTSTTRGEQDNTPKSRRLSIFRRNR